MTVSERQEKGVAYIVDDDMKRQMKKCRVLLQKLNTMDRNDEDGISAVIRQLFGKFSTGVVRPPFYCDYGTHIEVGKNFFANYNCTMLDVGKIIIGDNCQIAPNVCIYAGGHPIHPATRNTAYEYGKAVTIGDNVWIGGSVVVCPGVHIGNNAVIGAGSVVTRDIPDWAIAAGNPARVIRAITDDDKRLLFKREKIDDEAWGDVLRRIATSGGN